MSLSTYTDSCLYTHLKSCNVCNHMSQESIASYVERHTKSHVSTSLVQKAGQSTTCHMKLRQAMTRGQSHFTKVSRIPSTHQHSSISWIFSEIQTYFNKLLIVNFEDKKDINNKLLYCVNYILQLVNSLPCIICFGIYILSATVSPLKSIHRS